MFTGIVEETGEVVEARPHRLRIAGGLVMDGLAVGDSIAVNGVCLTVTERGGAATERGGAAFAVDVSEETLARTNLGALAQGDPVNLERALTPSSRMGGHIVQGHADGTGEVVALSGPPENRTLRVAVPPEIARYIVHKGFVAVDGVSLTVASEDGAEFSVAVIPYTEAHTVLRARKPGDRVNIEVDVLAKYAERLVRREAPG